MESNTYMVAGQTFELQHYGVKGMKWGRRKAEEEYKKLDKAKREYRRAGQMYRRAATIALKNNVLTAGNGYASRKLRDMYRKDYNDAKKVYKEQKKNVRENATIGQKLGRGAKAAGEALKVVGSLYVADVTLTGGATTRAAAKAGKAAVKNAMNKVGDKMFKYSVLDESGKILRRYN